MIKRLVLLSTLLASQIFADNIYNTFPTNKEAFAFKKGFALAVMSLIDGREYRIQGKEEEEVQFKDYLVIVDGTDLDDADKIAIQKIGFIYGDSVRLTDQRIVIADFERKANAITLVKTLNTNYFNKNAPDRRAYPYEKKASDKFYKEKSLFYEIANLIEEDLKSKMKVIYIKEKKNIQTPIKVEIAQDVKVQQKTALITPKPIEKRTITKPKKQEVQKPAEKVIPTQVKIESKINSEPFFIQFLPKGRYVTRYKLSKAANDKNISDKDLIKQSQIENTGELIISENYLITTNGTKFFKADNGFYYLEKESEVIADFVKEN